MPARKIPKTIEPTVYVTIRLPESLHRTLVGHADANERSLHQEVVFRLKRSLGDEGLGSGRVNGAA